MKDTCPSFSLSIAIFVIMVSAANLIAVDTSVLSLTQHQEIKLVMIYLFDQFLKFLEFETKCYSFITQKEKMEYWYF